MKIVKSALAGILAAGMMLSLAGCDEESAVSGGSGNSGAPDANANAVTTTPLVTTTYDTDPDVVDKAGEAVSSLDNPDLEVTRRLKWMAWWDIDETTAAAEMFKAAYGIPKEGEDASREGRSTQTSPENRRRSLKSPRRNTPQRTTSWTKSAAGTRKLHEPAEPQKSRRAGAHFTEAVKQSFCG